VGQRAHHLHGKSWKDVVRAVLPAAEHRGRDEVVTYLEYLLRPEKGSSMRSTSRRLRDRSPPFLLRSEQIAGRLVSGEGPDRFHRHAHAAYQYIRRVPSEVHAAEEGVVLLPQSMFILKKAPHPGAAKLWIDFILSERGQEAVVKGEALISGRAGFKSPLPEYAPSMDSLKIIKVDWEHVSTAELQKMREEWPASSIREVGQRLELERCHAGYQAYAAGVLLGGAAAAGGLGWPRVSAARPRRRPKAITPQLIEAARSEGKVVWYTSVDLQVAEAVGKAFEAKFPAWPCASSGRVPSASSSASARSGRAISSPATWRKARIGALHRVGSARRSRAVRA